MKRIKLRNAAKKQLFKLLLVILIITSSFILSFKYLYDKIDLIVDDNLYLNSLVNSSFSNYNFTDLKRLSSTEFLLKYSFGIDNYKTGIEDVISIPSSNELDNVEKKASEAVVYIFNTHQTEGYKSNLLEDFNINNTVFLASHILGEYLNDLGIGVVVEENSIVDVLNANGWKYGRSYKASRILLEEAYKNNPTLKFFIDLHRDSASYERTHIEIDNENYAKVLFVVGLEHNNYQGNLDLANTLNEKIKSKFPGLSRGVLEKKGSGVNGIYNQDFNTNTILIEVGGQYNYIEEVNNTLKIIAQVIYEYLNES